MKTKEFIKMLENADPSGESHIRINGQESYFYAEHKPGYWDGSYSYLEGKYGEDMVWVETTKGSKVDIRTVDMDNFVEYFDGDYETVKKHIKMDFGNFLIKEQQIEKEERFLKDVKDSCDEYLKIMEHINRKYPKKNK